MNLRLTIFISVSILVGLSVGFTFVQASKGVYGFVKNTGLTSDFGKFSVDVSGIKIPDFGLLAFLSREKQVSVEEISMGGPGLDDEGTDDYERFPGNNPDEAKKIPITNEAEKVPKVGKAVVADLEQMRLQTFKDGEPVGDYVILSKGRQGTAWETPPGSFEILYKTENHFSSIGSVWMPYSMQFFGNYFIHGWPYYPDGSQVPKGYSGGCIRLANEDMKNIYEFADEGTKVIVHGSKIKKDEDNAVTGEYKTFEKAKAFPKVSADSYIVADIETGQVIQAKSEKAIYPIASLSKLMTALISLDTINQYQDTYISASAKGTYGDQGALKTGEKITVGDLIYPLLLESSNDAAEALAEHVGRKFFIKNMNDKAKSIGLSDTSFEDPSGLTPKNLSTAEDLFRLTKYIYDFKSYILGITRLKDYDNGAHNWHSNSRFRNDDNYVGGKNGYTDEAKHTLITIVELPLNEFTKRKVAIVVLQSDSAEKDVRDIIFYLLNNVYFE